jgi:MFS family permease
MSISTHAALVFLAGCWISASFLASNVLSGHAWFPVVAVGVSIGALASLLYTVIARFVTNRTRGRMFAAIVGGIVVFDTFGAIFRAVFALADLDYYRVGQWALLVWACVAVAALVVLWLTVTDLRREMAVAVAVVVLLLGAGIEGAIRAAPYFLNEYSVSEDSSEFRNLPKTIAAARKPDVYYIVLDAYARPDQLLKHANLDVGAFVAELEHAGFVVPSGTHSNYMTTNLSMGHTLLADYFVTDSETHRQFLLGLGASSAAEEGWSPVVAGFERLGYRFLRVGACTGREHRCLNPSAVIPLEVIEVLHNTPVMIALRYIWPEILAIADQAADIPSTLNGLSTMVERPVVAFVHFYYPHDALLRADCSRRDSSLEQQMVARDEKDRLVSNVEAYRETIVCINRQLAAGLKDLLARPHEKIVVLTADHGSSFSVPKGIAAADWPLGALTERFAIFNAWYLPQECRNSLYDGITPVNHFRLIFGCLSGEKPEFIEDRSYAVFYGDTRVRKVSAEEQAGIANDR